MAIRLKHAAAWATLLLAPIAAQAADVAAIHAKALPFDPHVDIDAALNASADGATQFDLPKVARGGLRAVGLAVFAPQEAETPASLAKAREVAEAKHRLITGIATRWPDKAAIARTPDDVRRIAGQGKLAIVETIVNGGAFVTSLDDLDAWHKRGARIFGFVHAGHNRLADSSRPALVRAEGPSRSGGLSPLGKQAVTRLNALGVLIDISQLSDAAVAQVFSLTKAPVIASHSDVRAIVDNSRNLTDAQLDALKANNGVIAINAFSAYLLPRDPTFAARIADLQKSYGIGPGGEKTLSPEKAAEYDKRYHEIRAEEPKAGVADLVKAIDYVVKRIGIDHVAISSDFNHGGGIVGWGNVGEAANVTAELVRHGYSEADIAKLWSGNILRAWAAAQAAAG